MSLRELKMEPKSTKMKPFGGLLATRRLQDVICELNVRFQNQFSRKVTGSGQLLWPSGGWGGIPNRYFKYSVETKRIKDTSAREQYKQDSNRNEHVAQKWFIWLSENLWKCETVNKFCVFRKAQTIIDNIPTFYMKRHSKIDPSSTFGSAWTRFVTPPDGRIPKNNEHEVPPRGQLNKDGKKK